MHPDPLVLEFLPPRTILPSIHPHGGRGYQKGKRIVCCMLLLLAGQSSFIT